MPQERCTTCSYRLPPSWTGKRHCPACGSPLEEGQSKAMLKVTEVKVEKKESAPTKKAAPKKTSGSSKRNKK